MLKKPCGDCVFLPGCSPDGFKHRKCFDYDVMAVYNGSRWTFNDRSYDNDPETCNEITGLLRRGCYKCRLIKQ